MRRHNEAMEKLTKAKEAWYEREVKRKDKMEQLRQEVRDANDEFDETNKACVEYEQASKADPEPSIHNFYEPTDEMKKYQDAAIGIVGMTSGIVGGIIIKNMGCSHSKEKGPMVDQDVDVKKRLQVGLHLAKDEAGIQLAFGKTSRKKYGPTQVLTQEPTQVLTREPTQVLTQEPTETEV